MLALNKHWRTQTFSARLNDFHRIVGLARYDRRHTALQNTGLFTCDLSNRISQKLRVIERHRCNDCKCRFGKNISRINATTQPNLKQSVICRSTGKRQDCSTGRNLKIRDRLTVIGRVTLVQNIRQRIFGDQ